jgi:Mn2+/Fe2+ NRAMP family transporter
MAPATEENRDKSPTPPTRIGSHIKMMGPGILIAATGVGSGDIVAASVAGSRFGYAVVWAVAFGAILKYVLNEGLARWQLATGTTLIEGWTQKLGRPVQYIFFVYLMLWSFIVGGAMISACGLAAHAIAPGLSVAAWGALHSLVAAALILLGGYLRFEHLMKVFIGIMFVALTGCALFVAPPQIALIRSISDASIPSGSVGLILGVMGGIGGSVTLLSYGYWIREKGWEGRAWKKMIRLDLGVAYALTGIFGLAIMILAATVLHRSGVEVQGNKSAIVMADMLGTTLGPVGAWTFRLGFWAAVATSILGVWQGVPYMFADFVGLVKRLAPAERRGLVSTRSVWYRGFLAYLCILPLSLLFLEKPVAVIILYAAIGSLFMPFLAGTLLYMNSKREWVGESMRSGWITNGILILCLVLFGYLGWTQVTRLLGG